jgi:hypothetical protein
MEKLDFQPATWAGESGLAADATGAFLQEYFVAQVNAAVADNREDLADELARQQDEELAAMREIQATRSAPLMTLVHRAARQTVAG